MTPFLTIYTPTYRRPTQLARCLASVGAQTAAGDIEHLVIPDHVGVGIAGMYARIPHYVDAVHGRYVFCLADDDVLACATVVEEIRGFVAEHHDPEVVIVATQKGGFAWPAGNPWPPQLGLIDWNCVITRADVWKAHAKDYGTRYEGDFDFMDALYQAGHQAVWCPLLFSVGAVSRGEAEVAA